MKFDLKHNYKQRRDIYKVKDAVNPLYSIMLEYYDGKIKEDALRIIIIIAKKYPSDVINNNNIKNSYKIIVPSNKEYSDEGKKYVYILFKEIIKEGIIKKGEDGSELIEEILLVAKLMNKKKDFIRIKEELIKVINEYIVIAKEKGFEEESVKNKNYIIGEDVYIDWIEFCEKDVEDLKDNTKGIIKITENEEIKKFCENVASHSFAIQMEFINRLYNYINYITDCHSPDVLNGFNTRKNGLFLYIYLPLLFKTYHLEEILPLFLKRTQNIHCDIPFCYEYLIELYNKIIERMLKEEKEIEINKEKIIIIIFLWSIITNEEKEDNQIEYLINSTVKVLEWLGRIEEEKEEEIKEKENEGINNKDNKEEGLKENVNRKEIIINYMLEIISEISYEDKEKIKKDGRISKALLEIVKNHIKNERCLINKGNKKKIIEYVIYSYYGYIIFYDSVYYEYSYYGYIDSSDILSLPFPSFPFSHKTIIYILYFINKYFIDDDNMELLKRDVLLFIIELLNNYIDVKKNIDECDIRKEIEGEMLIEWNNDIISNIYKKISFDWWNIENILYIYLSSSELSSFNNENNLIIKKVISILFNHNNNNYNVNSENEKQKENNDKDMKEVILFRPFITDEMNRKDFVRHFISSFTSEYYNLFNIYFLINKSEEGYNFVNIFLKELSGEIVDRIGKRERRNIRSERRSYERERIDEMYEKILESLKDIMDFTFEDRNNVYLGEERNEESYEGKEEEIKEIKDYISDIIEEEDMRECLILRLKHKSEDYNGEFVLSNISIFSNDALHNL